MMEQIGLLYKGEISNVSIENNFIKSVTNNKHENNNCKGEYEDE